MSAHAVGEEIVVCWPGGPYDFVLEFYEEPPDRPAPSPGWQYIRGVQVHPQGLGYGWMRTFYVRPVSPGMYELMPREDQRPDSHVGDGRTS